MKRNILALSILAVFGFGLFAGPHPCQARQVEPESGGPSCHLQKAAGPFTGPSFAAPGGHDRRDTSDRLHCEHACHMTAVAHTGRLVFRIAPVARAVAAASCPGLSLLAHAIDHIPLT